MPNNKNLTREHIINYLVDCVGYSLDDINHLTFGSLLALLNNAQLSECLQYNNLN